MKSEIVLINYLQKKRGKFKNFPLLSRRRDSNPRPADYKSAALAN